MTPGRRLEPTRRQLLRDALVSFAAVLIAFAAFDDITTDTATTFTWEWAGLAICGVALLTVCWRLVRRERWWLASISAMAFSAAFGAGVWLRPGTDPFQIEYLMTIAGLLWFLGLAAGLTGQAWRRTDQPLV